mmetsp:Transcript_4037/g.3819  ORF Transcript_4037/g.3819 Transcript_4037/m.3819 type:complete len:100 (-) Transcript_4037:64-363(-)
MELNTFKKIKKMYKKIDVVATLKLLLRCQLIYSARNDILNIFECIRVFKILKVKAKNLVNVNYDFREDARTTTQRMRMICKDLEKYQGLLIQYIIKFLK